MCLYICSIVHAIPHSLSAEDATLSSYNDVLKYLLTQEAILKTVKVKKNYRKYRRLGSSQTGAPSQLLTEKYLQIHPHMHGGQGEGVASRPQKDHGEYVFLCILSCCFFILSALLRGWLLSVCREGFRMKSILKHCTKWINVILIGAHSFSFGSVCIGHCRTHIFVSRVPALEVLAGFAAIAGPFDCLRCLITPDQSWHSWHLLKRTDNCE